MELSTSTFILEIVNFAVLVWILKRLLYAPILKAIEARRQSVRKVLDAAEEDRKKAEGLRGEYEARLKDWQGEKEEDRAKLGRELDEERVRRLKSLDSELASEREKARVQEERILSEKLAKYEEQAIRHALDFSSKLLRRFASSELEERVIDVFLEDLSKLSPERLQDWKGQASGTTSVNVQTAYPLTEEGRARIVAILKKVLGSQARFDFQQDPALGAGVRVSAGLLVLSADLKDELQSFSEAAIHA